MITRNGKYSTGYRKKRISLFLKITASTKITVRYFISF